MWLAVCYGTNSGLHHERPQMTEAESVMLATMTEDEKKLLSVQKRYEIYKAMYTNCTVVDGNLEIVHLMGPGNQTFDLDFLLNIREVTSSQSVE